MIKKANFHNPLLEAIDEVMSIKDFEKSNVKLWKQIVYRLAKKFDKFSGYKTEFRNHHPRLAVDFIPTEFRWNPHLWVRSNISCSINDEVGYRKIAEFSKNNVWEVGSGSGYNAKILESIGVNIYPTDISTSDFTIKFLKLDYPPYDMKKISEIASNGGSILYIWAEKSHHHLDTWLKAGGKKVITCGCYEPDHIWLCQHPHRKAEDAPTICPVFPPEEMKHRFRLCDTHIPPHYAEDDPSAYDVYQFWELNE